MSIFSPSRKSYKRPISRAERHITFLQIAVAITCSEGHMALHQVLQDTLRNITYYVRRATLEADPAPFKFTQAPMCRAYRYFNA
jgi:hypothetical protein